MIYPKLSFIHKFNGNFSVDFSALNFTGLAIKHNTAEFILIWHNHKTTRNIGNITGVYLVTI